MYQEFIKDLARSSPVSLIMFSSFFYQENFSFLTGDIKRECCGKLNTFKGIGYVILPLNDAPYQFFK